MKKAGRTKKVAIAAKTMRTMLEPCKNLTYTDTTVKIMSALNDESSAQLDALAKELTKDYVCINKQNYSHHVIKQSGVMNVNCLSVDAPFSVFESFGFRSGRTADKFAGQNILRKCKISSYS